MTVFSIICFILAIVCVFIAFILFWHFMGNKPKMSLCILIAGVFLAVVLQLLGNASEVRKYNSAIDKGYKVYYHGIKINGDNIDINLLTIDKYWITYKGNKLLITKINRRR